MLRKKIILSIFFILVSFSLFGIEFSDLNLSSNNNFLFRMNFESQSAIFISPLSTDRIQQLTAFPEKLSVVDNGRFIQVTNRFGVSRIPAMGGLPVSIPGYPSFSQGGVPLRGRLQEVAESGDGRWLLYIEPTSPALGNLYLIDVTNGNKKLVSENVELPASAFPAKWAPDSRLFVYAKAGRLYYFPILSNLSVLVDERFRMMGSGSIHSIEWGARGDFFYFSGNTLYSVRNTELFTRTIYGDFLSIGAVAVILPFEFDPEADRYWIAPDSDKVILTKNDKTIFFFSLGEQNTDRVLPHVSILPGAEKITVLWSSSKKILFIYQIKNEVKGIHFVIDDNGNINYLSGIVPLSSDGALSPDGTRAIFWGKNGLELWDFTNWRLIQRIKNEPVFDAAWINNSRFTIGTNNFIEEAIISSGGIALRKLCLSGGGIGEIGFEARTQRVLARLGSEWFITDTRSTWTDIADPELRQISTATDRFRVFLEPQHSGLYKNIPMVRNAQGVGTTSFLANHKISEAFTQRERTRIALCFDLYNDDTGLYPVLSALRRNNIKATFFLNGEFIRRNPHSALAIVEEGHEAASMFYAPIDFSDTRFRITNEFIKQGLARNEDEFFNATGKELALFWHPPFYRNSSSITAAANAAGYRTIDRTIDLFDWVSREESARLNIRQITASQMIEQIINNRRTPAIIPIRLGQLPGGRDEYLYQRIDVLLDALVRSGIEVVPVSHLVR